MAEGLAGLLGALAAAQSAPDAADLLELLLHPPAPAGPALAPGELGVPLALGLAGTALRALAEAGAQTSGRLVSLRVRAELREGLLRRRVAEVGSAPGDVGADAVLATRGLDGLEGYHTQVLPALAAAAVVPAGLGAWILWRDPLSALIVVLTLPLVPFFMVLIGRHTQERIEAAAHGLDRLSAQVSELARGLPVLVGLRRVGAQRRALQEAAERHRAATMGTLRTAFLSGLALELLASLSVAVVAVVIGVRLVSGGLGLEAGLVVLVVAGEVYLPLRELGAAFHAAEDGEEARRRVAAAGRGAGVEDSAPADPPVAGGDASEARAAEPARPGDGLLGLLADVRVRHRPDAAVVAVPDVRARPGRAVVLSGPSGSGKSTALHLLAGRLAAGADEARATGRLRRPAPADVLWVGQHPRFARAGVTEELRSCGARDDAAVDAALAAVGLAGAAERGLDEMSPGERRRVALARLLVALDARAHEAPAAPPVLVLLDEPTAHLDEAGAARIRRVVDALARGGALPGLRLPPAGLVVASHDRALAAVLEAPAAPSAAAGVEDPVAARPPRRSPSGAPQPAPGREPVGAVPAVPAARSPRPAWRSLALPVAWGGATHLSAALLAGFSGWLIVQAAWRPPILHLLSVIVLVRAFGLSRALARYRERLATHDVVLGFATDLRLRLWDALGSQARHFGRLTRAGGALAPIVADVDAVRDAGARVLVPGPAAVLAWAGGVGLIGLLAPSLAPTAAAAGAVGLVGAPVLVAGLDRRAAAEAAAHRSALLAEVSRLLEAAPDIAGLGRTEAALERVAAVDAEAGRPLRRSAWAAGLGRAWGIAASGAAGVAVAAQAVLQGVHAPAAAFAVLVCLTWAEAFGALAAAAQQGTVLRRRGGEIAGILAEGRPDAEDGVTVRDAGRGDGPAPRVEALELSGVDVRWGPELPSVLRDVGVRLRRGEVLGVTGPSGSGKSTLLALLLGFLRPCAGSYRLETEPPDTPCGPTPSPAALRRVAWTPQEAMVFDSTVRGNLALARDRDDPPSDAELTAGLERVGLGPWLARQPEGLDARTGPAGSRLSGGQRQRLAIARSLVARADVLLLDEPTAHLGEDESRELMAALGPALEGTIGVVVTHDPGLVAEAGHRLDLPARGGCDGLTPGRRGQTR